MTQQIMPDFQTYKERDDYFRDNAEFFTVVARAGVGLYERNEYRTLADAKKAAQTKQVIAGGGWMIYAVIGNQSAFVEAIPAAKKEGK